MTDFNWNDFNDEDSYESTGTAPVTEDPTARRREYLVALAEGEDGMAAVAREALVAHDERVERLKAEAELEAKAERGDLTVGDNEAYLRQIAADQFAKVDAHLRNIEIADLMSKGFTEAGAKAEVDRLAAAQAAWVGPNHNPAEDLPLLREMRRLSGVGVEPSLTPPNC